MKSTIFILCVLFAASLYGQSSRVDFVRAENQPIADQGNGYYLNPIFPGNYGDPSIVRVGHDYYIAFSRSNGIMIWHSRDLVNWEPVMRHRLPAGYKQVWAVDLQYFDGKFHLYMPIRIYPSKTIGAFGNFVIIAENPAGPWSEPINLDTELPEGPYCGHRSWFYSNT